MTRCSRSGPSGALDGRWPCARTALVSRDVDGTRTGEGTDGRAGVKGPRNSRNRYLTEDPEEIAPTVTQPLRLSEDTPGWHCVAADLWRRGVMFPGNARLAVGHRCACTDP